MKILGLVKKTENSDTAVKATALKVMKLSCTVVHGKRVTYKVQR